MKKVLISVLLSAFLLPVADAQTEQEINAAADALEQKVIDWRRHIHQNPELSNREYETSKYIERHLNSLGLEVKTGIAHTGVVAVLKGGKPGPVVALRADMDALPVKERVDLPFASKAVGEYLGKEVPVMHACGHDTHVAMLMGVAELLTGMKDELPGTVKFIFQPAEEGAPPGEEGGAELMVKEGVLKNPDVDVIFGLHISAGTDVGDINIRKKGIMAGSDDFKITIKGKQAHGSTPWDSIDPVVTASQIINSLQTIVSRHMPITRQASVVTVGTIEAGVRSNIIPETAEMTGTIRTLSTEDRERILGLVKKKATLVGESMGAEVDVKVPYSSSYPVTYNNPELTDQMMPTLMEVAGEDNVNIIPPITGAEDFSFYAREIPGVFFFIGGKPKGLPASEAAPHHTPDFYIDESGMKLGVKALSRLAIDYLNANSK
ncbi:amidohydrolase [Kangiella sediminilitoris]|uniref:Carboxypeptidase n=1 Tax=Kangiella sediminilitoris TaxID=1144748 RepID=A0A1B3BAK3_9GAMM|nr:amidohydrolase [Kangiella sediminilitoris]AOE49776.1 carboxypeptidase [Kangiella sediminilitoris]